MNGEKVTNKFCGPSKTNNTCRFDTLHGQCAPYLMRCDESFGATFFCWPSFETSFFFLALHWQKIQSNVDERLNGMRGGGGKCLCSRQWVHLGINETKIYHNKRNKQEKRFKRIELNWCNNFVHVFSDEIAWMGWGSLITSI